MARSSNQFGWKQKYLICVGEIHALEKRIAASESERHRAMGWLRVIGRVTTEEQIEVMCREAVSGDVAPDTARLDAIERECADVELTCGGVWRVSSVDGDFEADSLRGVIDKLREVAIGPEVQR